MQNASPIVPCYSVSLMRQKILKSEQMQGTSTPTLNSTDSEEVNIHCHRTADTRKESGYYTQCPWVAARVGFPQGKEVTVSTKKRRRRSREAGNKS